MKQKRKSKIKKLDKNTKKIITLSIVFIFIIIVLNSVLNYLEKEKVQVNNSEYSNIQEILQKYGCTYIKENKSDDKDFYLDIYLKFKFDTFEKNESQERYYKNVIGNLGLFLNESFRLIDESRNLTIDVVKSEGLYGYRINGDDDYFANQLSKMTLKNYLQEENTAINVNSQVLSNLINNNWNYNNIDFGTKDSTFEKYEIYFEEGIEVRKISQKIYNIIFNNKYTSEVVNNLAPQATFEEVVNKLGNPTYGTTEDLVIGYKGKNMYIFFSENEISIYPNEKVDVTDFEILVEKYANNEIELKEFMNELTYIWDDYSEYVYDQNFINIVYPIKGVKINMNNDSSKNIQIYNNYSKLDNIKNLINDGKITGKLDENLVYLEEINRSARNFDLDYLCYLQLDNSSIKKESSLFGYYIENGKINFVSKDSNRPNITVADDINTGFWYTDTIFVYSIKNNGIYAYNLDNHTKMVLLTGKEEYTFKSFENNILTYDENKIIEISNI